MKLLLILTMVFSSSVFAVETQTECPMMKELHSRSNPKKFLNSAKSKPKPGHVRSVKSQ